MLRKLRIVEWPTEQIFDHFIRNDPLSIVIETLIELRLSADVLFICNLAVYGV